MYIKFKSDDKYHKMLSKKLTYTSGNKFYDVSYFILNASDDIERHENDKGEFIAVNFVSTGLLRIIFDETMSLCQMKETLLDIFTKALKVPIGRRYLTFHGSKVGSHYPGIINHILTDLDLDKYKTIEEFRIKLLFIIVAFWD